MTTPITKTQALAKCRPLLYAAVGVLSTLGVLSLTHLGPAQAQSPGVNLAALVAQVSSLTQNAADGWAAGSESPSGFSTNGNFVSHF